MIKVKGFNQNESVSVEKIFESEDSEKAMIYYKELSNEGLTVVFTNFRDMKIKDYLDELNKRNQALIKVKTSE